MLIPLSEAAPVMRSNCSLADRWSAAANRSEQAGIDPRGPICIVDDDPWVLESLSLLLEAHGFEVLAYAAASDALAEGRLDAAGCLIVDQHMPELAGLDLVAELQRRGLHPPTILITGRLDAAIARRAGGLGVLAILEKPFPVVRLVDAIRTAVGAQGSADMHDGRG